MAALYMKLLFILCYTNTIITPIASQSLQTSCGLPLMHTKHDTFIDYNRCSLYCDTDDSGTPLTNSITNKHISILFLSLLIPAFICNVIFTFNNINEHHENEETFDTTPITYDALFVIDVAYLMVIICLLLPHISFFDGGNTVSSTYICNHDDQTLSIGNPLYANNAICTLFGVLIFSGFKIILIYTGIMCVNIWYRLWRPMVDVGIKKRYIHGATFATVFIFDIFLLAFGGIDANPSNGMCYIPSNDIALLLVLDIIPNVLFIIISATSIAHAAKQLRQELNVIQQAELVSDDLLNLIHRMVGFLIMAVLGSATVVFTQIIWIINGSLWEQSTYEWIDCAQNKVLLNNDAIWKYKYGDECIAQLKKDGFSFPHEMFFIAFPAAALLSNISVIVLTCHRRTSDRWRRGTEAAVNGLYRTMDTVRATLSKPNESEMQPNMELMASASPPSAILLQPPAERYAAANATNDETYEVANEHKEEHDENNPNLSVKVRHSPQSSEDIEQIGTVRYHGSPDTKDNKMTFDGNATEDELPDFENADTNQTVVRHTTDTAISMEDVDCVEPNPTTPQTLTLKENTEANALEIDKETERLIEFDKQKSLKAKNKLEHISNVSFDYHNIDTKSRSKTVGNVPISKLLDIEEADSSQIKVTKEDVEKGEQVMGRIQSLELDTNNEKRDSRTTRSNTLPLVKRSSTQRKFIGFLDDALDVAKQRDLNKTDSKSNAVKSVRFMPEIHKAQNDMQYEHDMNEKAAEIMLRSTTDSVALQIKKDQNESNKQKRRLKKSKTSIDAAAIGLDIESIAQERDKSSPSPVDIGERRLSHKEKQEEYVKTVEERQKRGFFDRFGKRKKNVNKLKMNQHKRFKSLKRVKDYKTTAGTPIHKPSRLLKPVTMDSGWNINDTYFDEETDTDTMYSHTSKEDTFSYVSSQYEDPLDTLVYTQQQPTMQWQSLSNIFHFTLTDNDFKSMLHSTFTPHSTRNVRKMTFDVDDPYEEQAQIIIKEDEEITATVAGAITPEAVSPMSKFGKTYTQSMGDLKGDQSVSAIGSDGRIVLSDIGRFKGLLSGKASSVPISNGILAEDEEIEYDVKYEEDDLVKKTKKAKSSHHKTETLHGKLLDAIPTSDRKDLHITIHSDFSCQVEEKKKHYKAETAKLAFTLKPVHSMKILM